MDVEPISNIKKMEVVYRTSITDPIQVSWIKMDIGAGKGMFGITFAPGKKAHSLFGAPWNRNLELDLDRLKAVYQVQTLISLIEEQELEQLQIYGLVSAANQRQIALFRSPIVDGSIPSLEQANNISHIAINLANSGQRVVFHCRGGLGRAGTLTACVLTHLGYSASEAITLTRKHRKGALETPQQEKFVHQYAFQYS